MSESDRQLEDDRVREAFTSAAIMVLQELTGLEWMPEPLGTASQASEAETMVNASIDLVRAPRGRMSLCLTEDAALQLAIRYLPHGSNLTPDLINDVAGELANMIAGQAKTALKGTEQHYLLSSPRVIRSDVRSANDRTDDAMKLRFLSAEGAQAVLLIWRSV